MQNIIQDFNSTKNFNFDEDSPTSLATTRSPLFKNTLSLVISTFKLDIMSSCDFLSLMGLTVSIVTIEEALELNLRHNQSNYLILQFVIIHKTRSNTAPQS